MKKILCISLFILSSLFSKAQLENIIVEKYYISGESDTVGILGDTLIEGSVTHRVFVDLEEGYLLKALWADSVRPLMIKSDKNFFNHSLGADYGQEINPAFLGFSSLIPVDSWITLGFASSGHLGIPKELDKDNSSIIPGPVYLTNNDTTTGIPITSADGYHASHADSTAATYPFASLVVTDSTFGTLTKHSSFIFDDGFLLKIDDNDLLSYEGIKGADTSNKILIGQFTTKGELKFELNIIIQEDKLQGKTVAYVARDIPENNNLNIILNDNGTEIVENVFYSHLLKFPQEIPEGCTDPWFIEYDPKALIDNGSCTDSIVLGCWDPAACNYNPNANTTDSVLLQLCCYGPKDCNGRNIDAVCSDYKVKGCTDDRYIEYNYLANIDDGSCKTKVVTGCMESDAYNYNPVANDSGSCCYTSGCTVQGFLEYDPQACYNDGSCHTPVVRGCMVDTACNYNPLANVAENTQCKFSCEKYSSEQFSFDFYPNPANEEITINIYSNRISKAVFELQDIYGHHVKTIPFELLDNSENVYTIDLNNISQGLYLISVSVNGIKKVKRVIIK